MRNGFTLLELLIGLAVIALLAAGAGLTLISFQRSTALNAAAQDIVGTLRLAQGKAIAGEDGDANGQSDRWGVRFANGANDTWRLFYGNSYDVSRAKEEVYLSAPLSFSAPAEGNNLDVLFTKTTGTTTAATITISNADGSETKMVTINASGSISSN